MKLSELKNILSANSKAEIGFILPNGIEIPAHAHVTEVARISKHFIDCGGTIRESQFCRLQTWVANDYDHRLDADKLLGILNKATSLLLSDDLEVDIEHELEFISQFPLESVDIKNSKLLFKLSLRHTACLAPEKCCPTQAELVSFGKG